MVDGGEGWSPPSTSQASLNDEELAEGRRRAMRLLCGLGSVMLMLLGWRMVAVNGLYSLAGLLGAVFLAAGSVFPVRAAWRGFVLVRGLWRLNHDRCTGCGYRVQGLAGGTCPECGGDPWE